MKTIDRSQWYGASWKVAGFACYAGLNAIARYLSGGANTQLEGHLPVPVIVFWQDLIALLLLVPWIVKRAKVSLIPSHIGLHLARVVVSAMAIMAWYYTLLYMPISQAVALSVIGPMLGVLGAKVFLKERVGWLRAGIILLSLSGACLLVKPNVAFLSNQSNTLGLLCLVLASSFFAIAKLLTRRLATLGETAQSLTSYLFIFIVPVSLIPAMANWVMPLGAHLPWLCLAGVLTALAIYCVSCALVHAEVSFLAPFDICQFMLNAAIGYLAFMEIPSPWAIWLLIAFLGFTLTVKPKRA